MMLPMKPVTHPEMKDMLIPGSWPRQLWAKVWLATSNVHAR